MTAAAPAAPPRTNRPTTTRRTTARTRRGHDSDTTPAAKAPGDAGSPPPGGGSDHRVQAVLAGAADLTVTALAEATGLGKSTVAKALTRLAAAGLASRTPGGGAGRGRQPDRWNPATPTPTPAPPAESPRTSRRRQHPGSQHSSPGHPGTRPPASPTTRTRAAGGPERAAATPDGKARPDAARRNPRSGTVKLAPGGLTQLVAEHYAAHPGVPLTAGEVGRALNRSGGAVRNAADKLTSDGVLQLLDGTPRRYTTA